MKSYFYYDKTEINQDALLKFVPMIPDVLPSMNVFPDTKSDQVQK